MLEHLYSLLTDPKSNSPVPAPLFHLNTGSVAQQYTKQKKPEQLHPVSGRGVSRAILGSHSSKIICACDEVIRVYSFDFDDEEDEWNFT